MGLLDGLTPVRDIEPCKVTKIILSLSKEDAAILTDALQDERWTGHGLSKALKSRGLTIAPDTLRAHMLKECKCWKI